MRQILISIICAFFLCASLYSTTPNPSIPSDEIVDITPFLLPQDHPLQQALQEIFPSEKVLQNYQNFSKNGFKIISDRKRNKMKVVSHPKAPGYLFKFFVDSDDFFSINRQRKNFISRCQGATIVRDLIAKHNMSHFCVPQKWIYELPQNHVVLVVEKINILSRNETINAWKTAITPRHLQELYSLLSHLPISRRLDENLPYTKDGKFAFIDTERRHVKFLSVQRFFSPSMQSYWRWLLKKNNTEW